MVSSRAPVPPVSVNVPVPVPTARGIQHQHALDCRAASIDPD